MQVNIQVTLLVLSLSLVSIQTISNCEYSIGDSISGTYCLSCNGSACTKCYNGFVDNGRCAKTTISNCLWSEKNSQGIESCKVCHPGYYVVPDTASPPGPFTCLANPITGNGSYRENCAHYVSHPSQGVVLCHSCRSTRPKTW